MEEMQSIEEAEERIDWNRQAKEFLELHGWYNETKNNVFGEKMLFHPGFPMGEDCSKENGYLKLAERYGEVWETYKSFISSSLMIHSWEENKVEVDS